MRVYRQKPKELKISSFASSNKRVATFKPVARYAEFELEDALLENEDDNTETEIGVVKKALVAVEGEFADSDGTNHVFTSDRLQTIADHTNQALEKGIQIPVCLDHQKNVGNTVGGLGDTSTAYTKVITEEDLPNPRAKDLIGKIGLFLNDVIVKAEDAVDKVKKKIVTSVSMGLNLDPKDHRIVELSLVPIPAIPHMGLFSFSLGDTVSTKKAMTWEELEASKNSLKNVEEEFTELTEELWSILQTLYTSESTEIEDLPTLKQYVYTALNGYSIRVLESLGLNNVPDIDPAAEAQAMSADQSSMMQQNMTQDAMSTGAATYSRRPGLLTFTKKTVYSTF